MQNQSIGDVEGIVDKLPNVILNLNRFVVSF